MSDDSDDAEVDKLFRENDNLGDDANVLLRPLRQLFVEGKPPGQVTPLSFRIGEQTSYPFGALYVGKNRMSFWPVYPKGTDMAKHPDHITLELPSGKSHWTGFDANGKPHRLKGKGTAWRLHRFTDSDALWWFPLLVRWDTLAQQDTKIQRRINGKSEKGKKHAIEQFAKYAEGLAKQVTIPLPPSQLHPPNYVLLSAYVCTDSNKDAAFHPEMFISDFALDKVTGWKAGLEFAVQAVK